MAPIHKITSPLSETPSSCRISAIQAIDKRPHEDGHIHATPINKTAHSSSKIAVSRADNAVFTSSRFSGMTSRHFITKYYVFGNKYFGQYQYFLNDSPGRDMARFTRMQTLNTMYQSSLVLVFYHADPEVVINVTEACAKGGARLIEFTNRGDFAFEVFSELEKHCRKNLPEMVTGVGSIVDPETAALYINHGANFVVGPVLNADVARTCNRRKIPYSPGCGSASEVSAAEELGCEIVKVFPGEQVGGPEFVKSLRGPCPWVSLMPTGGVEPTEESLHAWFGAGIVAAGIGSKLVSEKMLAAKDYNGITEKVRTTLSIIAKIKESLKK